MASIFHTISQMLAVGNGLVGPVRDSEYVTFIISLVLGANLYAVFVGTLISVIEDANGSHREYCKKTDMLQTWMAQRQLPRQLRRKLEYYYELLFPGGHAFDDSEILASLSAPLLEEVSRHKCRALLKQLGIDWEVSPGLARRLSRSLLRTVFVAGDEIVKEGEPSKAMYFINAGCVDVLIKALGHEPIKQLHANEGMSSLFGEMALLSPDGRAVATIKVSRGSYCDAFELTADRFRELAFIYPSFRRNIQKVNSERDRENQEKGIVRRTVADGGEFAQREGYGEEEGVWEGPPAAAPAALTPSFTRRQTQLAENSECRRGSTRLFSAERGSTRQTGGSPGGARAGTRKRDTASGSLLRQHMQGSCFA